MNYIKLNNGIEMPQVGLGTYQLPEDRFAAIIGEAYRLGYRQFDTAWYYRNEKLLANSLRMNGIPREEVFLTTKINVDAFYRFGYRYGKHRFLNIRNFRSVRSVILESFDNLQTDYIDLFLVHWPWPMFMEMYKGLTDLYHEGRIRAIGVCSFTPGHLRALEDVSDVVPTINQIEISPLNTQKRLIQYCQEHGIQVEAMSTFSHFRSSEPRLEILENPILKEIASRYDKTVAQVVLRWLTQQGIAIIPKTKTFSRLKENIEIFQFELSQEDIAKIDAMDQGKCLNYNPYSAAVQSCIPEKYR